MRLLALVAYASADQRNRDAICTKEGYSTLIAPRTERSGPRPSAQRSSQKDGKGRTLAECSGTGGARLSAEVAHTIYGERSS